MRPSVDGFPGLGSPMPFSQPLTEEQASEDCLTSRTGLFVETDGWREVTERSTDASATIHDRCLPDVAVSRRLPRGGRLPQLFLRDRGNACDVEDDFLSA